MRNAITALTKVGVLGIAFSTFSTMLLVAMIISIELGLLISLLAVLVLSTVAEEVMSLSLLKIFSLSIILAGVGHILTFLAHNPGSHSLLPQVRLLSSCCIGFFVTGLMLCVVHRHLSNIVV